jgi:hypothetical protein
MSRLQLSAFTLAIVLGIGISYIDSHPGWDDTGVTTLIIFLTSGLCGYMAPQKPWSIALAVGIWVPLVGIITHYNMISLLAFIPAFAGAYTGSLIKRKIFTH